MTPRCIVLVSLAATAWVSAGDALAQDSLRMQRDVIRGTITSDSIRGIAGVDVVVSMAPDRSFQRTRTDEVGHYEVAFEHGTGDYLVHVSTPGMKTVRKRVTRQGTDSVFFVNVVLEKEGAQQLTAVIVTTSRQKPTRYSEFGLAPGTGAMERVADGVNGAVSPDQAGDIAAIAGTISTLLVTPNGVSAGGTSPQQNSTTLNGMAFPGADLPRDALTHVRVRTSAYDPAEGWFGSVQQAVELGSGIPLMMRHAHLTLDAPFLQYTDPYSDRLGQRFANVQASLGSQGPADRDKLEYNYGVQAARRVADGISLSSAPNDVLERANIAPDSATRLLSTLSALGVPLGQHPEQRVTNNASFVGLIGSPPFDFNTFKQARSVWDLVGYAKAARVTNVTSSASSAPGYSGSRTDDIALLQAHLSTYVHDVYLAEVRSALSIARTTTTPFLSLPTGLVLLDSDLSDGGRGFSNIAFGGNSTLARDLTQWTWETAANVKLYPPGPATHRIKIAADSRVDGLRQAGGRNTLGTFTFNSIGDVSLNEPFSFTRMLRAPTQSAAVWNGFVSFGDWWRKSDSFQLLYGARLEGDRFLRAPAYNPAVESSFRERTDFTPNTIHVSPRIGFTYTMRGTAGGFTETPIGRFSNAPTGYLRGGVGEFRTLLSPALVAGPSARTGLASAAQTITCVGAATPAPLWSQYAADPSLIPTDCVGGAAARTFADAAPSVELVDRSYTAPRSWRANLAYGSVFKRMTYSLEGAYSLNLNQPGRTDLNFANSVRFITSDEGRPVYVAPTSLVPASGALVSTGSRRDVAFGQVVDNVSSLRSVSRQATLSLAPDLEGLKGWFASLAYTISNTRALASGFDNSTFGSPLQRDWARGDLDVRHRIVLQGGIAKQHVALTLFGRIQSGFPFTPLMGSDVNGDGVANDRAFIFDPARIPDSSLARGMQSLLSASQGSVRRCLISQSSRAASPNSCDGPWTASLNVQFDVRFMFPRTQRSSHVAIALTNPLGGLDQVLHGVNHLHGWGTNTFPDPVLYNVRGFDPVANRFHYEVNPRFGDMRPTATTPRVPFRLTLDFSMDLAPPSDRQFIERELNPGRRGYPGPRLTASIIKRRYNISTPDPYRAILEESDSLMLSRSQTDALQDAAAIYRTQRDTIFSALADYLANLDDHYVTKEAVRRQNDALNAAWELGRSSIKQTLPAILNRYQLKMLPWPANRLYTAPPDVRGTALAFP